MRKLKPVFLLLALLSGAAFAAEVGVSSRATTAAGDDVARAATTRTTANRVTASRNVPNATSATGVTTRATVSRATVSRGTDAAAKSNTTRSTVSRSTTAGASRGTVSRATTNNTAKTTNATRAPAGDINSNPAVRRAGVTLRPSFADYGGRATIAGTGTMTGSNVRNDIQKISGRAAKNVTATAESIVGTRETLERTAELNKSCQEQYTECMDQFCAVIDANQKRCSCSSNLSRYTKVEKAVTEANNKLNEVAQAIRYIGLSADEIRAIMSETEAEEALRDNKDTSTTRNMLKQIESMIKDPTSTTNNYVSEMDFGLDMDLTFSSDPVDIFNLDFLNLGTNNSSISNLRGTELYRTAKKRCNTILTRCKEAGATQDQIIGNYDLAIDKDCIDYEAGLKKMNETLLSNVKSANLMLQKARLAVAQNKNQYDALGCVAALENCMKDDMVCGDDYLQCVDPTKAYIDESGEVVMGQDITVIQSFMTKYNNAVLDKSYLQSAYNTKIDPKTCTGDGKCVVKYLLQKIGTKQKVVDEGLCRAVLDKCQSYTYDKDGKYKPYNDIVINYLQRAMVSIKAAQQRIISDYASSCITDVAACYSQQVTQVSGLTSSANKTDVKAVMRGACRSIALTCGLAIFTGQPDIDPNKELITSAGKRYTVSDCKYITGSDVTSVPEYGTPTYNNAIINCVSDMFYDSLLSTLDSGSSSSSGGSNNGTTNTTYTVTYTCGDGATGSSWTQTGIAANQSIQLPADPTGNQCTAQAGKAFNGWNVNGTTTNAGNSITVSRTMTISAMWVDGTYTLTYSCGEGTPTGDATSWTVTAPAQYTLPADPTGNQCNAPVGKTFGGWLVGANTEPQKEGIVNLSAHMNITAAWVAGNYTVTFDANGATEGAPSVPNVNCVTGQECLCATGDAMKKTGYHFDGVWNTAPNGDGTSYTAPNCAIATGQNTTLYAVWTQNGVVNVTYDCDNNGNSPSPTQTETVLAGQPMTVAANNCTKPGYTRANSGQWAVYVNGADNSTGNVAGGTQYTTTSETNSVKFKATWTPKTFTINYNCGEGTGTVSSGTATFGSSFTPATSGCSKTDYNFNGWNATINGATQVFNGAVDWTWDSADTTITFTARYAQGEQITCDPGQYLPKGTDTTCTDCLAGHRCPGESQYHDASADQGIYVCADGYVQPNKGQSSCTQCPSTKTVDVATPKTGTGQCPNGDTIQKATGTKQSYKNNCPLSGTNTAKTECQYSTSCTPDYTNQTCYVTSCATGYVKKPNTDQATECVRPQTDITLDDTYGNKPHVTATYTQPMPSITCPQSPNSNGYEFLGYYDTANNTGGTQYYTANCQSAKNWDKTDAAFTLYARWQAPTVKYDVTYNCNGGHIVDGTSTTTTASTEKGSYSVSEGAGVCARDGYAFSSWNTEQDCSETTTVGSKYYVDKAVTFYACWTEDSNDWKITYNCNGGTGNGTVQSVTKGSETQLYSASAAGCSKSNANFAGWKLVGAGNADAVREDGYTFKPQNNITANAQWTSGSSQYRIIYSCGEYAESEPTYSNPTINTFKDVSVVTSNSTFSLDPNTYQDTSPNTQGQYPSHQRCNGTNYGVFMGWRIKGDANNTLYYPGRAYQWPSDWNTSKTAIAVFSTKRFVATECESAASVSSTGPGNGVCLETGYKFKCNDLQYHQYTWDNNLGKCIPACNGGTSGAAATTCVDKLKTSSSTVFQYGVSADGTSGGCATYYCKCGTNQTSAFVSKYQQTGDIVGAGVCTGSSAQTYTVTYSCGMGTGTTSYTNVSAGATITLKSNTGCTRDNYSFGGWNTKQDGTGTDYSVGASYPVSSDVTLYAKWVAGTTPDTITVTYKCSSSLSGWTEDQPKTFYTAAESKAQDKCNKGIEVLNGWSTDGSSTVAYQPASQATSSVDITLTAVWSSKYKCSAGTYLKRYTNTSCTACPAGSYCPGGAWSFSTSADQGITACTGNTYSQAGASSCTSCGSGQVANSTHTGCEFSGQGGGETGGNTGGNTGGGTGGGGGNESGGEGSGTGCDPNDSECDDDTESGDPGE